MRIPSGVTDQYIYFVAVDATDLKTRETGLSTWTVYRSRNGGAAAAWTTPTINETDTTNMPGVYELLMDEDMTLDAGDQSQEMVVHITHTGMAPVTRTIEIYRPSVTAGETITVSSGAVSSVTTTATATAVTTVNGLAANVITATSIASDALTAAKVASDVGTEIGTAVWATATRALTVLDEDSTTLDLDATIRAAVGLASADLDTQLAALPTAAENAAAVWDEDATSHQTGGTFGQAIGDPGADTNTIFKATVTDATGVTVGTDTATLLTRLGTPSDLGGGATVAANLSDIEAQTDDIGAAGAGLTAINLPDQTMNITGNITGNLSGSVGSVTGAINTAAGVITTLDALDTAQDTQHGTTQTATTAIKAKTDSLTFTVAGQVDANIQYVNDVAVTGTGAAGDEWGP